MDRRARIAIEVPTRCNRGVIPTVNSGLECRDLETWRGVQSGGRTWKDRCINESSASDIDISFNGWYVCSFVY